MKNSEITEKVASITLKIAKKRDSDNLNFSYDDILPKSGVLDSLGILELIMAIEEEFKIGIPQSDITIENLGTINYISNYLEHKLA